MKTKPQTLWQPPYHVFQLSGIYSIVLDSEMDQPLVFANNNAVRIWITRYLTGAPLIFYYERDTAGFGQNLQNVRFKNYAVYEPKEESQ